MSLNQLPNDLITHIGSFLSFEDNIQFGLCQKRIHSVLKRDGHDKPNCETLEFTIVAHPHCKFWLPDSTNFSFIEKTRDPKFNSLIGQVINKFRKIENIEFYNIEEKLTENVLKDFINTKTKLSSLSINHAEIDVVDPNLFLAACNKFDKIELHSTILPPELLCDQVFVELIPNTKFSLRMLQLGNGLLDGYLLTDRTLNALTIFQVKKPFDIGSILNSFPIDGIKNLVQELLKSDDHHVVYNLGILRFSELRNAVRWMDEVAADLNCPYIIRRYGLVRGKFPYMINVKNNTLGPYWRIEFAINHVEA